MPKYIFHRPAHYSDRTVPRMLLPSFHFGDKGDKAWTRRHVCLIYPTAVLKHLYSQTLFWRLLRYRQKRRKTMSWYWKTRKQNRKVTKVWNNKQRSKSVLSTLKHRLNFNVGETSATTPAVFSEYGESKNGESMFTQKWQPQTREKGRS